MNQNGLNIPQRLCWSLALLAASGVLAPRAEAQPPRVVLFNGHGYGTMANIDDTILSGKSAPVFLGCGADFATNTVASVDAAPLLTAGNVTTTAEGTQDPMGGATSRTTAVVNGVSLLEGFITAQEVRAVSTSRFVAGQFSSDGEGSSFVELRVAGQPFDANPEPNTEVQLAGYGRVVFNEQIAHGSGHHSALTVNLIHVFIEVENPLAAVGTEIVVSSAFSKLRGAAGRAGGRAFGTSAELLELGTFGPTAAVGMPCGGTNNQLREESVLEADIDPFLHTGTVHNTAQGTVTIDFVDVELTARVQSVDLLDGLVRADLIEARSQAFGDGDQFFFTSEGSAFVNLRVQGFPHISDNVPPNTKLTIPDLGTLWLKRVILGQNKITTRMIELVVTKNNPYGLPIGSRIQVAVAIAVAR